MCHRCEDYDRFIHFADLNLFKSKTEAELIVNKYRKTRLIQYRREDCMNDDNINYEFMPRTSVMDLW